MTDVSVPGQQHGVLVLNKPKGPTSARCLDRIKKGLGQKKIGHAGTLDPMATGVLLVMLGHGTKIAQYLLDGGKTYSGMLRLGETTDTYDAEGEVTATAPWEHLTEDEVREEISAWTETTMQTVPPYSAAKHKGKPLYKLAREGKEAPVKEKAVEIFSAEVLEMDLPRVRFRVACGSGTYIRSLVHSLGMRLGCGAVLEELTRERSHPFTLDQAHDLDQVLDEPERLVERVLPLDAALPHWPRFALGGPQAELVRNGARLPYVPAPGERPLAAGSTALFTENGAPLALVELKQTDGELVWAILRGLWT